jgi:hypothetical protein
LAGALLASLTVTWLGRAAALNLAIAVVAVGALAASRLPARTDRPSALADRPSATADRPSATADRPHVGELRPSAAQNDSRSPPNPLAGDQGTGMA